MTDVPPTSSPGRSETTERQPAGSRSFELYECLGRGGFGEVYRASMVMPSGVRTVVAVKVLRQGLDPFGQSVQRLRDEAHLLSALDHPAILKVHDLVVLEERVALVTEYVEGEDLSRLFQKPEPGFGPRALAEAIAEVASALEAAWSRPVDGKPMQLVHRDIKPANVRLGRHGQVKLLDFGIARANIEREASTTTDTLLGTYQYMAPERFGGAAGPHADVFALGCLLYEGIAGQRFLNGLALQAHYAVLADRSNYDPALAEQLRRLTSVPASTRHLLDQVLSFDPAERPPAGDLAAMCEAEATFLRGSNLRTWAREREWPSSARPGELTGRVLQEGLLDPQVRRDASVPPDPRPVRRLERPTDARAALRDPTPSVETVELTGELSAARRRSSHTPLWVWLLLLGALGTIGGGVVALTAGVVVGQAWPSDPEPVPVEPVTEPWVPAPWAVAPTEPTVPEPEPEPLLDPEPAPVEPEPVAAPEPNTRLALVRASSPVPVRLEDGRGVRHAAAGELAPGSYVLRADFGQGFERAGTGEVQVGRVNVVRCKKLMRTCVIEGG
jgi:serine/threonine protein kinase